MGFVKPNVGELLKGWTVGFIEVTKQDMFSIAGILGAVVMPHNLFLHTAAVQKRARGIRNDEETRRQAIRMSSLEPIMPILLTFFVNLAVISISAESVYGSADAASVGLTDFCLYFQSLPAGCALWSVALLSAGQSGAITTTFTGTVVMDGFLQLKIPVAVRSIVTRIVAIVPSVICAVLFPTKLNQMINVVNALLGLLLPFAFTPLVKFNCCEKIMGDGVTRGWKKRMLYSFALIVWAVNALTLSMQGGGFFGDASPSSSAQKAFLIFLEVAIQVLYALYNFRILFGPLSFVEKEERKDQQLPAES